MQKHAPKEDIPVTEELIINFLACSSCGRRTEVKNGFIMGVTLYKNPLNSKEYLCANHMPKQSLPWRIREPNEFRAFLSQFNSKKPGKKKIMGKIKKARV